MILNADVLNVGQRCAFAQPTKLYLYPAGGAENVKLAVELDYRRSRKQQIANAVVSAFKTRQSDIDGMIKGGIWEELN